MHVFPTENFQSRLENDIADPADFHPLVTVHAHGRQSVTSVVVRNRDDTVILFSCGRDGHFVEYELSSQSALAVVQRQRVAKGLDWAERVSISDDGDVLVLGFIKNDMVIINVSSGLMLLKIPCSGGHHAWAFTWRGEMPIFAFFSGHTLHVHGVDRAEEPDQRQPYAPVLKEGMHGREITCALLVPACPAMPPNVSFSIDSKFRSADKLSIAAVSETTPTPCYWAITGGESCKVVVSTVQTCPPRLHPHHTMAHAWSVRALAVAPSCLVCGKKDGLREVLRAMYSFDKGILLYYFT